MLIFWPILLPFAAFSGWIIGKRAPKSNNYQAIDLPKGYVKGINYILNEQPDQAIDVFIKMLDVDKDTVETHLALGGLFRRRGEVDRAIRIHQNLIARPQLFHSQRLEALMALGNDYMCAGVYDRAERIFKEVSELGGNAESNSLKNLLSIYQQQKLWHKALSILQQLQKVTGKQMSLQVAHCYCELVEMHIKDGSFSQAADLLKKALYIDKNLVRTSLLNGRLEFLLGNYKQAIKSYKKVSQQDSDYLSEIIKPLFKCYQYLKMEQQFYTYMNDLLSKAPLTSIIFWVALQVKQEHGDEAAIDFVTDKLSKHPSLKGLKQLIEWHLELAYGKVKLQLSMLYDITEKLLEDKPAYRCDSCGFSGQHLHWNCPSCKKWSTTKPIYGIEGE